MDLRKKTLTKRLVAIAIAATVLAEPLVATSAAHAATAQSPAYFNRKAVVGRAARWTRARVPYSQTSWRDDYRTDCSGFISYAWGLDQSFVTWSLPKVSRRIAKEDLQPGDILLNDWKHAVLFGGWTNRQHTQYLVYEQVGGRIRRAVSRVVAYPYQGSDLGGYKPYRYTGGHNIYAPDAKLPAPLIQSYAGGRPFAPTWAAAKNAQRNRIAAKRAYDARAKIHARQRAEAAAKAKAKADAERRAVEAEKAARQARAEARRPAVVRLVDSVLALIGG